MRFSPLIIFIVTAATGWSGELTKDLVPIDEIIQEVGQHARNYPPRFASMDERRQMEAKLREAITRLDALAIRNPDDPEYLLRDAQANAMGHNLDFKGCAQKSTDVFKHLLALRPDDREANFHYGVFLGSTNRPKESLVYLKHAVELGATEANYSLAVSCLMLEDKPSALIYLRNYVALHPRDDSAKKFLEALESKGLKIEKKIEKMPDANATGVRGAP